MANPYLKMNCDMMYFITLIHLITGSQSNVSLARLVQRRFMIQYASGKIEEYPALV